MTAAGPIARRNGPVIVRMVHAALCALVLSASAAEGQTLPGRTAIEAVGAVSSSAKSVDSTFVFLDLATMVRLGRGVDLVVRPYARRLPGGDWDAQLYQAQIRYQPADGVRLDAGIISSPLGLATLELRADLNPTVGYPFYYFARLPSFDHHTNGLQILAGGYPLGAVLNLSGARWDARAAVTDGTPARYRKVFGTGPRSMPQFIAGGGISPIPGLRVGGGVATGKYRRANDTGDYFQPDYGDRPGDASALVVNLEAEFAFRYTRLSGEWVRDRFETDGPAAVAHGLYVQAVQTLSPRTFAAARFTHASTPTQSAPLPTRSSRSVAELTFGYRLAPELTLRAGYERSQGFLTSRWNHAGVGSIVWSKRWF